MLNDEEKKKREEEAKQIISNMTNSKDAINTINYNKYNIQPNNDNEKEYINRIKEANDIINSINPRENVSAPSVNEEDKIKSQKSAMNFINLIDGNVKENNIAEQANTSNIENSEQQEVSTDNSVKSEAVNVILNGNKLTGTMTEEEKAEQEGIKQQNLINARESNSDKKLLSQLGKTIENLWLGAVSGVKSLANYVINTEPLNNDQKAQQQAGLSGNNNIPTIVKEEYKNNTDTLNVLNNIPKEKLYLASEEIKQQQNNKNIPISEQTKQNVDSELSKYTDAYGDLELNPGRRALSGSISKDQNKIATNVNKISNPVLKKVSELAPSTGNSLLGAGISIVNPYLGMSYFMVSASGSYEADGRNRGMTKEEARDYGMIMGWAEGASEMIEIDKFLKAGSSLRKGAFKEALKNYGLDMVDNAIQEAVIDPVDELAAQLTSGKTKNDYSSIEGYKQLTADMIQDGIDGALSSLLMNGLTAGIDSSIYLYNKIQNNENITQQDIKNAYIDIQNNPNIDIKKEFQDSFEYQKDKLLNNSNNVYTVLDTNNEGIVTGLKQVIGEQISLNNDKLNIIPVVVYNDGYYNVIDGESGTKLDTTMYNSQQEAVEGFNNKITNIDDATIKNVNNQVTKSKLALINKIQEIQEKVAQNPDMVQKQSKINFVEDNKLYSTDETKNILNNYNIDTSISNRPYIGQEINDIINNKLSQANEDKKSSTFYSNETNYAVNDIKKVTEPFGEKKTYTKNELADIWNNNISDNEYDVVYDNNGDIQSYIAIEEDGKNLVVNQYDNQDNVVKSEIIPSKANNLYTAEDVRNTIEKVASIYDENKPIKGQVDIEGNEVRSMKKNTMYKKSTQRNKQNVEIENKDINESIEDFKKAKNNINRQDIINIANNLGVYHRGNTYIDETMQKKSGNNLNPKIINIDEFFKQYIDKEDLRKQAYEYALDTYKNKIIIIKDIKDQVDIPQSGIKKTFGKNQNNIKMQTANNLPNIIEEGIYLNSSKSTKNNNIVYHYFYTPISISSNNELALVTIRQDLTNKNNNNKFYYHDIREIKNIEKDKAHAMPHKNVSNMLFEQYPSQVNNSITQKKESVKNDKNTVTNSNMQNNKNNTSKKQNGGLTKVEYDSKGRELTYKQSQFFKDSKVRDKKGKLLVMYHGTPNGNFTIFNDGTYFTANKEYADKYQNPSASSINSGKSLTNPKTYEVYLNIRNPFDITDKKARDIYINKYIKGGNALGINPYETDNYYNNIINIDWTEGEDLREFLKENYPEYDGLILDEGGNPIGDGKVEYRGKSYLVFNPNQIKNITNEQPTSNDDIRYMKKSNTTSSNIQKDNTLIAQHNTSEEKLLEALDLGALPVPSIAITKYQNPILKYGDITLLFNKDTINPTDKRNVTYNSDIYSTRKPETGNILDKEKVKSFEKIAVDKGIGYGYLNMIEDYIEQNDLKRAKDTIQYELQKFNENIDMQEIEDVYTKALETIKEKRVMKPGVDPYTPSGNKKSIGQMSLPYTLDNIVQTMTKKNTKGSESNTFAGLAEVRANLSQKFKSIDSMHKSENNLITSQEMDNLKEELNNKFYKIVDNISKYDDINRYFGSSEAVASAINETAKSKNITKEVLDNELDYVSIKNVPDNILQETVDFLNSLKYIPTEYFESKPQRAVGFDEVKKAIIPKNTSKEIIDKLEEKGVSIEYYNTQEERTKLISGNQNIRFAKRSAKENNIRKQQTQRNAERSESYIEQEIQKIEKTGNWDDSIPVTKLTDIRRTLENYLGLGIQKGHFRQQAYGIYKTNRDVLRTKELKDMDTILHEAGHAMDLGNRIKIDKESIANELLTAISKTGGYENETRQVQLDEGFAEIIREYSIVPDRAKTEYPQTVAVLEGIRQNDKSFDNFITKVQQQTYNYIHQNPRNRTLSNVSIGEQTDKQPLTKEWIKQETMRNIWDKDYALKSAVNELNKGKNLSASDNAYYLTRLSSGIGDKVISMLSDGYIDENGNKLMPGLNKIGEILENNPERFNDLRVYLVAKRDVDYKAKTLKTGIRTMDSNAVIEQFKNDIQIQEASKLVYDTLDGVLQYVVNNHLIDQETSDKIKESNAFYVPMQRVLGDNGNNVGRRGAVADVIQKRTGSELDVKDVLENIIANSSNMIQQVENNNILRALYKEGESSGLTGAVYDVIDTPMVKVGTATLQTWEGELKKQGIDTKGLDLNKTIDLFAPNNKVDSRNLITSFIDTNGKRVYLQFNDELLFNSIMNMDSKFMSQVLKINSKLNMPLRYGATMANLGFAIPNMISDTAQAAIYSTAGFIPVVDNAIGVLDVLATTNKTAMNFLNQVAPQYAEKINAMYTLYQQTGATSATRMSQYRESTQNLMKDVYGTKNSQTLGIQEKYKPLKRLLDILTYIPELSEQSTRFRVFERSYDYYKNKGSAEMDARIMAALESRDATQDFGRTGNLTREINQLIPFSAARVGSIYTFAEKVKANPKQVGMRIAVLTAIAMTIKAIGYDDDEIEELNQRKKDDNFVLKIGDNIVTIKKPQGILRSMINFAEYIQDLFTGHIEEGKEGERLGKWINDTIMDNMPADSITGLVPNMVAPLIENAINKDFYYNTDIVKSYDLELPDSEQYYDYNSQLAIWLGKVFNYSPAKIDNLISGYFAGLGTSVTDTMDYTLGKLGITAEQPEMGAEDNAVAKRFIVNVNSNSASIDEMYNRKTELTKKSNSEEGLTPNEKEELESLTNATSNISKINKQIKEIKKDLTMNGKEKAEQIKLLQEQKTDMARESLGKEVLYKENKEKNASIQFYTTSDSLKKNGYTLAMTSEMKKEYEKIAYEYYSKYESQGIYNKEKLEQIETKAKDYAKTYMFSKYKSNVTKSKK